MQAEKMGERQVFILAGIGLIIAQLILAYLGLGGRSLVKSFCWFLKNRYKLSLYLCIVSVLVCRALYGQITYNSWYIQLCNPVLPVVIAGSAWLTKINFSHCRKTAANILLPVVQPVPAYASNDTSLL